MTAIKNARTLGLRLDRHTAARLENFERRTFIDGVSLGRAALYAALDAFDAHGALSLPLQIVSATATQFESSFKQLVRWMKASVA